RLAGGGFRGATVMGFEFETIKNRGVMACRDHHPANGALLLYGKGNGGRWGRRWSEHHLVAVPGDNLSSASPKPVRKKPSVVTDNPTPFGAWHRVCTPVIGRRLGNAFDVPKREILRDDRPPTVRPEFNL